VQIKVLLADDSNVMRHAISRLLLEDSDLALVGQASGLHEALEKSRSLQPDVVIMDLHMARCADGDADRIKAELSIQRLIAISFSSDDEALTLSQRFGADMFIDKVELSDKLIPAIRELCA
jgi:two-component system, NarL family, nitrate/nitrite response regulator NarL